MEMRDPGASLQCRSLKIAGTSLQIKEGLWLQESIPKYPGHLHCPGSELGLRMGSQGRRTKELTVLSPGHPACEGKVLRIMSSMMCGHVSALKTYLHEHKSTIETEHLSEERLNSAAYATLCKLIILKKVSVSPAY